MSDQELVRVARATVRDARAVAQLVAAAVESHQEFEGYAKDLDMEQVREYSARFASEFLRREDAAAWLAFDAEEAVVGVLTAVQEERGVVYADRAVATLADAYVVPEMRKHGVLAALVAAAEAWARGRGLDACVVEHAMRNTDASSAWTRLGYGSFAVTRRKRLV